MMLSACSEKPSVPLRACPNDFIPAALLTPCPVPRFDVQRWGDYPDYVARLHLALDKCNSDKAAIAALLSTKAPSAPQAI
ncbi:hypothetical protein AAGQ96_12465 [Pantoea sp. MBD-2R]|uniref:Rz1-like lysis system protein LysC n=1 Tax=Pantoea sp. MBD-2R TaxID=3141540 RepID=UPI003182D26B